MKKIANGFLIEYQHWLDHLPNKEVFVPSKDMATHANLIEGLVTYEQAVKLTSKKEAPAPQKTPPKKTVIVEDDVDL